MLLFIFIKYRPARDFDDDLKALLKGLTEFESGAGTFSEILAHGPLAFPIATTEDGRPFLAGSYYGLGRILVVSHEGCLSNTVQSKLERMIWLQIFSSTQWHPIGKSFIKKFFKWVFAVVECM